MTDEQILNALKACGDSIAICDGCPYEGRNYCSLLAKQDIIARFEQLKAENAALRERLEKAVELPAKVGEKIYMPWEWDGTSGIAELTVCNITLFDGEFLLNTDFESDDINFKREYRFGQFREYEFGTKVFTTRKAAVARLAELKGGEI